MPECSCRRDPWWARQLIILIQIFFNAGSVLAILTSWEKFHHVGYSTFAAFAGWLYVLMPGWYDKAWMG